MYVSNKSKKAIPTVVLYDNSKWTDDDEDHDVIEASASFPNLLRRRPCARHAWERSA